MQAIILAAGMGNRLGKYTKNNTKCMLDINGRTLISRALDALESNGINKCVIVVGYQKLNLMEFVGTKHGQMDIIYVSNDIYNKTNNIYSLYLAKDYLLQDDTLLLESDLIFEDRIIADLLSDPEPTLAVVDKYQAWMDGTVVQISPEKIITQFIPKKFFRYDEKHTYYKTVNIYKFSKEFLRESYVPFLEAYSHAMGNNEYYEQVLRVIMTLEKNELKAFCLSGHKWYEIDDVQDKDIAENIFGNTSSDVLDHIQKRYGGYWRFPYLTDFCYLVNPYFPTDAMLDEIKSCFHELLADYPSGQNVQNLLAGKMFGLDESCILVGNGAAELIRALANSLSGSIGVIYPTFNEYPESFVHNTVVPFIAKNSSYTIEDLLLWSSRCDNLLLINPDNPSGNFISKAGILKLLDEMKKSHKRLVLDESFVDFCSSGTQSTMLDQDILERYPELIIIKSISKSYGVPGIRLGVLASGDPETIRKIRKHLSIWNINSFAEFFLQIIGKYKKEYRTACERIIGERERFRRELETIQFLEVLPSQANYFMCKCTGDFTARDLTKYLLGNHDIYIKDLTGKKGIEGDRWIRLAVRDCKDNDLLIEKLKLFAKEK
jgi:histidinol-phosphate/aromatic aminotransferase/cobyric acid decarboxylase-like protein/choline kinase